MKAKTSFLNPTVLKKDITRYAPVWGAYTILLLLILFGISDSRSTALVTGDILDSLNSMAVLNLIYAGICGAFLFMDLFSSRLCNALHAFPLRRESWLATHILSGFLFSFVPNLLVSLLGSIMLWDYAYIAPIWLAVSTLQFLFFFGTAVLAAVCAGNLIGMAAIYGIIHFITLLIYAVVDLLYVPLLYGVQINSDSFYFFFPLSQLIDFDYVIFETYYTDAVYYAEFHGFLGESWLYLGLCAAAGVVSVLLAWLIYRRRQLEAAGDLLSLKKLSPLFLIFCTVGAGAFLFLLFQAFGNGSFVFLVIGMVIGYFAGRMLLNRTVKVFTKKAFLILGVLVAVLAGSLWITRLDPLGIARYVPDIDKVQQATVIGADKHYSYAEPFGESEEYDGFAITEYEELVHLQDFHRQLIQYRPDDNDGTMCKVTVLYTLENGRTVKRYYHVGRDTSLGIRAGKYFNDMRYIFDAKDPAVLYEVFESVSIDHYDAQQSTQIKLTDPQQIAGLLDAVQADCEAGTMAQNYAYHDNSGKDSERYYVEFRADDKYNESMPRNYFHLQIWPDSVNTMAYMNDMMALHAEAQ